MAFEERRPFWSGRQLANAVDRQMQGGAFPISVAPARYDSNPLLGNKHLFERRLGLLSANIPLASSQPLFEEGYQLFNKFPKWRKEQAIRYFETWSNHSHKMGKIVRDIQLTDVEEYATIESDDAFEKFSWSNSAAPETAELEEAARRWHRVQNITRAATEIADGQAAVFNPYAQSLIREFTDTHLVSTSLYNEASVPEMFYTWQAEKVRRFIKIGTPDAAEQAGVTKGINLASIVFFTKIMAEGSMRHLLYEKDPRMADRIAVVTAYWQKAQLIAFAAFEHDISYPYGKEVKP